MVIKQLALICSGASLGALCRYMCILFFKSASYPFATIIVNILGCFCIGFLWGAFNSSLSDEVRLFLVVGFLSALTTFSSYGLDIVTLIDQQNIKMAVLYIFISNGLGLTALYLGSFMSKYIKTIW
tara:strand:+ start:581 stop:958 length:378 start_codon:yes stop_codon:yes gene_type:complete